MVTIDRNRAIARDFFARFSTGDVAGAIDLLSVDVTWWIPGDPATMPAAGLYTKDSIAALFGRMVRRLEGPLRMDVIATTAEGDRVALEVESHGDLSNGRRYHNTYHTLMRIADGRICEVREYSDSHHAYLTWFAPVEGGNSPS
jgi:ketosteroid isomerase-like protein